MSYTLFGQKRFGSTCIEAALELLDLDYEFVDADPLGDAENRDRVASVNPVGQVPALILPNDDVMTESAAILIYLGDLHPQAGMAPTADAPERAEYLRWLLFLSSNFYPTLTITDDPHRFISDPAQYDDLLKHANARRKELWQIMNDAFAGVPGPFLLGERMSMLDLYAAMMTYWSPRRDWFMDNCPNLASAVRATEKHPVVQSVWTRNFELEIAE